MINMSNPENQKNLWKNIEWKTLEEKEAFYNKYFKNSKFSVKESQSRIEDLKRRILQLIDNDITVGKSSRKPQLSDVRDFIKDY